MLTLVLVPIGRVELTTLSELAERLRLLSRDLVVLVNPTPIQPPMEAYDWRRGQYRSEFILEKMAELRKRLSADILIGVASIDAYSNGLNFVFGEAQLGRGVAVVYTRRLHYNADPQLLSQRLLKEVLHELGHAIGLGHCRNRRCVMSFSNSVLEVDEKTAKFCRTCAAYLASHGVRISSSYILEE